MTVLQIMAVKPQAYHNVDVRDQRGKNIGLPPFDENSVSVITEQPQGDVRYYSRAGYTVEMTQDGPTINTQSNSLMTLVFGENGDVWIKNPISNDVRESWVRGFLDEDKSTITVKTGQFIDYMPSLVFGRQLWVLDFDETTGIYSVNPEIDEITYILSENKIQLEGTSQQRIIGSVFRAKGEFEEEHQYEGTWSGYGNYESVYNVCADQPISVPASANKETITFRAPAFAGGQWSMRVMTATLSTDENDVYLSGFCSSGPLFTQTDWTIKGHKENENLVFASGQFLGSYSDNPYYLTSKQKGGASHSELIFSLTEEGTWETDEQIMFNMTSEPENPYFYYDGATLSQQPLPSLITPPVSARPHLFKMNYKGYIQSIDFYYDSSTNVTVATADDKIYIKGLYYGVPEAWIEGDIVDGKAVFKTPQYLGYINEQYPEMWAMAFGSEFDKPLSSIVFDYDNATGALSNASANIAISICNRRNLGLQWFFNPSLEIIEVNAATPSNPHGLEWRTDEMDQTGTFIFEIPTKDINNEDLVENWLYYRIYTETNGTASIFTMNPDEYPEMNLTESLSLFPYNFMGYDISWAYGAHYVTIRGDLSQISRIGVQSLYDAGGEERLSDIIWLNTLQSGIDAIVSDNIKEDDSLYNLQGQRVYGNPTPGIYIQNGKKILIRK